MVTTTVSRGVKAVPHMILALTAVLQILALFTTGVDGIKCYECVHNGQRMKRQQRYIYPCSDFDYSDRFIRDCPDSQLCIYQHITLRLATGTINVHTMDGCTPNMTQLTRYSEAGLVKAGCIQHISRYKPPSSIWCYCDYNLCNGVLHSGAESINTNSFNMNVFRELLAWFGGSDRRSYSVPWWCFTALLLIIAPGLNNRTL